MGLEVGLALTRLGSGLGLGWHATLAIPACTPMHLLEGRELLGLLVPRVVERYALDAAAGLHPSERRLARLARLG